MRKHLITLAEAKHRHLKEISFRDASEYFDANYTEYSNRTILNTEICDILKIGYPKNKQCIYNYVYGINNAFLTMKLKHYLFNVYDEGWELKSYGKQIAPLTVNRSKKHLNTIKRSIKLYSNMALAFPEKSKERKILEAQAKLTKGLFEQLQALTSLDISLSDTERKAINE